MQVSLSGTIRTGSTEGGGTHQASRVADVLLEFLSARESTLTELTRRLGSNKAVVHRILKSLESRDLVRLDAASRTYHLGAAATALGAMALRACDLRRAALPALWRLQHETEETATIAALVGFARIHLDQVPSPREVRMTVELGRPFPLHAGATGKALLAFASSRTRARVLEGTLPQVTPNTIVDPRLLEPELRRIRDAHVAVSFGERQPGAGSVSSPVLDHAGESVGAITVCGPVSRFDVAMVARVSTLVRATAAEVSQTLLPPAASRRNQTRAPSLRSEGGKTT